MVINYPQPTAKYLRRRIRFPVAISILLVILGCGNGSNIRRETNNTPSPTSVSTLGYTIQAGAFANINNAVRFAAKLQAQGLEAYHFRDSDKLFKVRFGNYPMKNTARLEAENLKAAGILRTYYLVAPRDYTATGRQSNHNDNIREEIVNTAKQYIGVDYRWGGHSSGTGFDCSGLTMVVYRLNGLDLPRSSSQQWKTGKPISGRKLSKGDLVFFATSGGRRVSHVGIYIGDNKFLHAPGSGRKIRISSLSNKYFKSRYLGARSYL